MDSIVKKKLIVLGALLWIAVIVLFFWLRNQPNSPPGTEPRPTYGWLVPILAILFWGLLIAGGAALARRGGRKWKVPVSMDYNMPPRRKKSEQDHPTDKSDS